MKSSKIKLFFTFILFVLILTACSGEDTPNQEVYTLPNLASVTIENYVEHIDSSKVTIRVVEEHHASIPEGEFIRYGSARNAGDKVNVGVTIFLHFSKGPVESVDPGEAVFSGVEDIEVKYASEFDPLEGVTVTDNLGELDRTITVTIRYNGNPVDQVNTWDLNFGTYVITYSLFDRNGDFIQVDRNVNIIRNQIDYRYTEQLKLEREYEGKDVLTDGIGVVTLARCIDGDTARFWMSGENISVRFLGIDTPETHSPHSGEEPWGRAASDYVCDILEKAGEIVIEFEGWDGYNRALGWIWVDGQLLNLRVVEAALSHVRGSSDSKYFDILVEAERKTMGTLRRIWGELDPNFNY